MEAAEALEKLSLILMDKPPVKNVEKIPHAAYAPVIKRYCELLHQRYGGRLMGVLLFGSIARGDWEYNSDIDLLIVVDEWDDQPAWIRVRELQRVRRRLRETREYKTALEAGFTPIIQHYPLSLEEAKEFHRVYVDACIDGVILYDKNGFLEDIITSLRNTLAEMGARRIVIPGRGYYWVLKEVKLGEVFKL
ncbi:MAG: nucleotidyltransferase domain-containing protein [Candidatus Geothermarchaeales archaeon]